MNDLCGSFFLLFVAINFSQIQCDITLGEDIIRDIIIAPAPRLLRKLIILV